MLLLVSFIFFIPYFLRQGSGIPGDDLQKDSSAERQPSDAAALPSEGPSPTAANQDDAEPSPNQPSDSAASQDSSGENTTTTTTTTTSTAAPPPSAAVAATAASAMDGTSLLQSDTIDLDAVPEAWLSEDALSAPGAGESIDIDLAADLATGLMLEGGEGGGREDVKKQD